MAAAPPRPAAPAAGERHVLDVTGMHCASGVGRVEKALLSVPGVVSAQVNLATNDAAVVVEPGRYDEAALVAAVGRLGEYKATPRSDDDWTAPPVQAADRGLAADAIVALALSVPSMAFSMRWTPGVSADASNWIALAVTLPVQLW